MQVFFYVVAIIRSLIFYYFYCINFVNFKTSLVYILMFLIRYTLKPNKLRISTKGENEERVYVVLSTKPS